MVLLGKRLHGEVVSRAQAGGVRGARESKRAAESVRVGALGVRGPQRAGFPLPSVAASGLVFASLLSLERGQAGAGGGRP